MPTRCTTKPCESITTADNVDAFYPHLCEAYRLRASVENRARGPRTPPPQARCPRSHPANPARRPNAGLGLVLAGERGVVASSLLSALNNAPSIQVGVGRLLLQGSTATS